MKSVIFILTLILSFSFSLFAQQTYIKVGEAQGSKSQLAFPYINVTSAVKKSESLSYSNQIHDFVTKNLALSGYFNLMNQKAFLEDTTSTSIKSKDLEPTGFSFDSWKKIGAEFLIRSQMSVANQDISLDLYIYQVNESKTIIGKKYKGKTNQVDTISKIIANDILETLTGQRGAFGSKIVATTDKTKYKEVVIMDMDGGNAKMITNDRSVAISPNWSPDGQKVLYSVYTRRVGSAQQNLTLFQEDLKSGKRSIISNRNGLNSGATYSPQGDFIYLSISQGGSPDLYKLNTKGDIVKQLTKGPAGALNVESSISPDGDKIAFSSDRGGNPGIYVMSIDSAPTGAKKISNESKFSSSPSWSPDGKKIVYASQVGKYFNLFIMNSDGTQNKLFASGYKTNGGPASFEDPSFSPDGRFVAYTSNKTGSFQIYLRNVLTGEEHRVTNDSYNYYKPKWSQNVE